MVADVLWLLCVCVCVFFFSCNLWVCGWCGGVVASLFYFILFFFVAGA